MTNILLFLLNFNGAIGFSGGYYNASLKELNTWLVKKGESRIHSNYTIGVEARSSFLERFLVSVDGTWAPARKSADGKQSLEIKSVDGLFGYRIYLLPALLYFYINGGYELATVSYNRPFIDTVPAPPSDSTIPISGMISGPVVKASLKFIPTPRLAVEFSMGYKYVQAADLPDLPKDYETKQDSTGTPEWFTVPMNLSGLFFKVSFLREFGNILSY
ncbi:MAG: hypothetical protein PHE49_02960 [bacterium]|nr:hypothetical protein [bacterium]